MRAHVLLNLLIKLRKREKIRSLRNIISLFHNKFNEFNHTGARMIGNKSILCMTLKLLKKHIFGVKTSTFCEIIGNIVMRVIS